MGLTVDVYATAFPDMHRELYSVHTFGDIVLVELSLNGTHNGDLVLPPRTIPPSTQTVVWPSRLASGALIYPYAEAKQSAKT